MTVFYVTQRPFGGLTIPVPIQNSYLRSYAKLKNLKFALPISEVCFPHKYPSLIKSMNMAIREQSDLVLVSGLQLPLDLREKFNEYLDKNKAVGDIQLHCALEGTVSALRECWYQQCVTRLMNDRLISKVEYE